MRQALSITFLIFVLNYPATAQQQPPTTVRVGVAKAELPPIAKAGDFIGRVEAITRTALLRSVMGLMRMHR
jgi:hypothetical protein